jgi:hypothetical protein
MNSRKLGTILALTTFGLASFVAVGAPIPADSDDTTKISNIQTTVQIRSKDGARPITIKVPEMNNGETREVLAEDGTKVKLTRNGNELTVNAGFKDIVVTLPPSDGAAAESHAGKKVVIMKSSGEEGQSGEKIHRVLFLGDHQKLSAPGEAPSAEKLLEKAQLKSYDRLDPKTRSAVNEVLQELLDKGDVIAPLPPIWVDSASGDEVRVEVRKEVKKN